MPHGRSNLSSSSTCSAACWSWMPPLQAPPLRATRRPGGAVRTGTFCWRLLVGEASASLECSRTLGRAAASSRKSCSWRGRLHRQHRQGMQTTLREKRAKESGNRSASSSVRVSASIFQATEHAMGSTTAARNSRFWLWRLAVCSGCCSRKACSHAWARCCRASAASTTSVAIRLAVTAALARSSCSALRACWHCASSSGGNWASSLLVVSAKTTWSRASDFSAASDSDACTSRSLASTSGGSSISIFQSDS
mmetsp:Transcript_59416/g.173855  ORF Transcript_59416/g.173855 Transcript_59416/m.173855 type:complete len:252 (+) Transcript_59416:449-1204(+)